MATKCVCFCNYLQPLVPSLPFLPNNAPCCTLAAYIQPEFVKVKWNFGADLTAMNTPTNSISCTVRFKEYYKPSRKIYLKGIRFGCVTNNILQDVIIVVNWLNQSMITH